MISYSSELALYSVNLRLMGWGTGAGKANLPVSVDKYGLLVSARYVRELALNNPLIPLAVFVAAVIAALYWFFGTELGASLRATGANSNMARAQGINTDVNKVIGLMISNALVALAGALLDEAALMPRSFVEQAIARCSVNGSKIWFNCNPEGPQHWFYREWILKAAERRMLYLHFTMEDNPGLSRRIRSRYQNAYSGVFYRRFVLGEWIAAQGLVYDFFDRTRGRRACAGGGFPGVADLCGLRDGQPRVLRSLGAEGGRLVQGAGILLRFPERRGGRKPTGSM